MVSEAVVDGSAAVKALVRVDKDAAEVGSRLDSTHLHTPHLFDAEVGDALRRLVLQKEVQPEAALTALVSVESLVDERYPHGPLVRDAWQLRDRVRFYDALYVVLAARLALPLLTADARLSRAHGLPCEVEVV